MAKTEKTDNKPGRGRQREISDNPVGNRILEALDGRPRKWLAARSGLSESTVSDYIRGGIAKTDAAVAIAEALEADLTWLLTGKKSTPNQLAAPGDRIFRELVPPQPGVKPANSAARELALHRGASNDDDIVEIAELDLQYGLGGAFVDEDAIESEPRHFSRQWLRNLTDSPPAMLFWARGRGNSMSPTIEDGEIVLGDRSQTHPRDDDLIWACALGEIGMIKRLRVRADHVKILSDNPLVPEDIAHPDDNLRIVGRIITVLKNL